MSADTQIKSFFQRWERLEGEKKAISDDLKELFSEAKHAGYDSKALRAAFNRKVKQDAETTADQQFDMVVDTYLDAINGVARDARMHARENIEKFDPETGEILEDINPRLAKQVVVGMQTEAGRAALIAAVDILIEQEEAEESRANVEEGAADESAAVSDDPASRTSEDSERQRASMVGVADDCRTGGKEQSAAAAAPVGDAGAYAEGIPVSNGSRPAYPAVPGGEPSTPSSDAGGVKMEQGSNPVPGRRDVKSPHSNAESERATNTNSEIDPNEDREEGHSLDGNADANAGGGHVNVQSEAAQHQAGALVTSAPAIIFEACPRMPMKALPYAHCFPELTKTEYQCLAGDISINGVLEPIIRMGDVIVDGWNRYNAARSLGIEYPIKSYSGNDVLLDVIKWQRSSRDWTTAQESKIASALSKAVPHRSKDIWAAFHQAPAPHGEEVAA